MEGHIYIYIWKEKEERGERGCFWRMHGTEQGGQAHQGNKWQHVGFGICFLLILWQFLLIYSRVCAHKAGLIRKYGLLVCRQVRENPTPPSLRTKSSPNLYIKGGGGLALGIQFANVNLQCFREKASDIGFVKVIISSGYIFSTNTRLHTIGMRWGYHIPSGSDATLTEQWDKKTTTYN